MLIVPFIAIQFVLRGFNFLFLSRYSCRVQSENGTKLFLFLGPFRMYERMLGYVKASGLRFTARYIQMLYIILLLAASSSLCVAFTTRTVQLHTAVASATPTIVRNNITSTRTISVPLSQVQTPKPQLPAGWASHSNESDAQNTSHSGDASLASGFGTACCGWGGIFGWTGNGEAVATMAGNCDLASGLPLSSLDLNQCISWDSSSGFVSCGTG